MRGKALRCPVYLWRAGITPAHAGKSALGIPGIICGGDHPRACGEKIHQNRKWCRDRGSPPRMRGKVAFATPCAPILGITPAHAGKSRFQSLRCSGAQDHPRACGEKKSSLYKCIRPGGSPPRMRGKVPLVSRVSSAVGITPAHAGKRYTRSGNGAGTGDHPRACGEKVDEIPRFHVIQGSPPRMRGKVRWLSGLSGPPGITPAHAGKSYTATREHRCIEDHPRACGEKAKKIP